MSEIDHEAAKAKAEFCQSYPALFKKQEANLCRAYLDSQRQLAAERARVEALAELVERMCKSLDCLDMWRTAANYKESLTGILNAQEPTNG